MFGSTTSDRGRSRQLLQGGHGAQEIISRLFRFILSDSASFRQTGRDEIVKILVAEDERDIRELIVFTLRYGGFEVHEVSNGSDAVEKAPGIAPDLILMDVRMPKMTGYQACETLKKMPETRDIPVVFLSAKGQESEISQGLEVGAEAYILKPFGPDDLIRQIKEIMSNINNRFEIAP
jgi:CheY-like chemotaxis protein